MDLRIQRTKRSIINAFIELRTQKSLNKITVKELSELAFINKATFYSHYSDIYDLSEQLENETIDKILMHIPHPEELIENPKQATETLAAAFFSQNELIDILFSDSRTTILVNKLEQRIKHRIYNVYPEYKNNLERDVLLTILIQGGFHAFLAHAKDNDNKYLIDIIGNISKHMLTTDTPQTYKQSPDIVN